MWCLQLHTKRGAPMSKGEFNAPKIDPGNHEDAAMPYPRDKELSPADTVKQKRHAALMAIKGVEGVGTTLDAIGNEGIVVYVRDAEVAKRIPRTVDGLSVQVQVTGPIEALKF
jgi:hypothetical protein